MPESQLLQKRSTPCKGAFLLLLLMILVVFAGCVPHGGSKKDFPDLGLPAQVTPRISGFLHLKDPEGPAVRLDVAQIEILADDRWLPLTREPLILDSQAIGAGQIFLGNQIFPSGTYKRMRIEVTQAAVKNSEGVFIPSVNEPFVVDVNLVTPLELEPEDSRCLLLAWDVEGSLSAAQGVEPVLIATPSLKQLTEDLVFVACPNVDTVFVVRADINWVVDSFGVVGGPTYLGIEPGPFQRRIYILSARDTTIKVVDLASYRTIDFFPAPLGDHPTFMTLGPLGREAFLLDERSGYITRIDLGTGDQLARIRLDFRPQVVTYLENKDLLAVTLGLSQEVLLLDPVSLRTVDTIGVGSSPDGLAMLEDHLYVAESGDGTVSVVDLETIGIRNRFSVGLEPRRLQATVNQLYVSNYFEGSLSVLVPDQFGVNQNVYGFERPREMAFNEFYRRLFVADEKAASLGVVDVNINRLVETISLGASPLGLAVIQ